MSVLVTFLSQNFTYIRSHLTNTLFHLQFSIGAAIVLVATFLYGSQPASIPVKMRPPPIRIESYEKGEDGSGVVSPPNDFSIKLPTTPLLSAAGLSSSRPTSPSHSRVKSNQNVPGGGYFPKLEE